MKEKEYHLARQLRKKGWSLRAIAVKVGCAKSSVSSWIRDIPLTSAQIRSLKLSQDRGRAKAANHPNSPKLKWERFRAETSARAKSEIKKEPSFQDIRLLGTALYWAEGYNRSRNLFVFANSDPDMIVLMRRFLLEVCQVPAQKMRGRLNIHPSQDVGKAERYWSKISRISKSHFYRPLLSVSRASQQKGRNLPLGTFRIVIPDVVLCSKIRGWIQGIKLWTNSSDG